LGEYVSVYEQQIESLNNQIASKQAGYDDALERKRVREAQEQADAAKEAKQNEYNDMRAALDDAKADQDIYKSEVAYVKSKITTCEADGVVDGEQCDVNEL
jgi:predicted  nucleic acid-binding Zn-ribbon protein